jgi:hypothetical protein
MKRLIIFISVFCLLPAAFASTTTYYVDSQWAGAHTGAAALPWQTLAGNWATIHTALASGPVIIYLTARQVGSDIDAIYSATGSLTVQDSIDGTQETGSAGNNYTIDGSSFYNTSESSPNWVAYSGASKARINDFTQQDCSNGANNPAPKHSNATLHGVHVVMNTNTKGVSICGDNVIIEFCELEATANASNGPLLLLVPTADVNHQGSSCPAPKLTNVIMRSNLIHDSWGETVYVGAGGDDGAGHPALFNSQGYPSHDHVQVNSNIVYNAGTRGTGPSHGQGDGIDGKGGLTSFRVKGNIITNCIDGFGADTRAIVIQGGLPGTNEDLIVEGNFINGNKSVDGAIALVNSYGNHQGSIIIRNNLILNDSRGNGMRIYTTTNLNTFATNYVEIYNNTVISNAQNAINSDNFTGLFVTNNIFVNNNGGSHNLNYGAANSFSDYNANSFTADYGSEGTHSFTTTLAACNFVNAGLANYHLLAGSVLIDVGFTLTAFNYDHDNTVRPQGLKWEIGAYELIQTPAGVVGVAVPFSGVIPGLSGLRP